MQLPLKSFIKPMYLITEEKLSPLDGDILHAIYKTENNNLGLSFIPNVIKFMFSDPNENLSRKYTIQDLPEIHKAMFKMSTNRVIELRLESGLNRLTAEELNLCPSNVLGGQKHYYSWTRELE